MEREMGGGNFSLYLKLLLARIICKQLLSTTPMKIFTLLRTLPAPNILFFLLRF